MASLARPKRAAEDFARSHHENADSPQASKKPRFDTRNPSALAPDAPEDDITLDADVIGSRGQHVRRNAVNIDGYDSDSDNEGFSGETASKAKNKAKEGTSKDEEEADMFADLEENSGDEDDPQSNDRRKGDGSKKAVRFLHSDEIAGQVSNSVSGGHVSANFQADNSANGIASGLEQSHAESRERESSSESEVDDETRDAAGDEVDEELGAGAKKTHAPKLDAFNMRSEQEDGRFDDQGNYVRKAADPDGVHDNWLAGLSKKDVRKAKEAAEKREEERRRADIERDSIPTSDALQALIKRLEKGETVLEALARLGKGKDKKPKWQKNKNRKPTDSEMRDVEPENVDSAETTRRATVETITESADLLLGRNQPEIYDASRALLMRQYQRETGEEWTDPPPELKNDQNDARSNFWEYRWSDARDGGEIHGPYDGDTMQQWNSAGYFGEGVEFKRADDAGRWSRAVDF